MSSRTVTVFGGTGFLGRRIVDHLHRHQFGIRVASRHPDRTDRPPPADPELRHVKADVHDERSVAQAVAGAYAAVNAVSLYVEHGAQTFHSVHVDAARRLALAARQAGLERFVHVSGIGADARSRSLYIRKRGEGEAAVQDAFPDVVLIRPAVMFGPDDAFLTILLKLLRRLPAYPLFGRGETRLQPVYVDDVGEAISMTLQQTGPATYELGGPRVYSYRDLVRAIARAADIKPMLIPVPFVAWHALAALSEVLPSAPLTRNQVELMQIDNVTSPGVAGFEQLGISPRALEDIVQRILSASNR